MRTAKNRVPVGVADGKIPNGYITASSQWNKDHAAYRARLYTMVSQVSLLEI